MASISQALLLTGAGSLPQRSLKSTAGGSSSEFQQLLLSQLERSREPARTEEEKTKAVAKELESELLKILFKSMWDTLPKDEMLYGGTGSDFYREMWMDALSEKIARNGSGLGLASVIEREISQPATQKSALKLR